ncbi:hypothetical protein Poli38472_009385 [Pythium oligandrum]|uniref:Uncharacterized protein n=1 Tax=Pythium oligandrum TaxID=41045 RepID=A0A8K1FP29_PYTOL|nr:hypothetical protein Poli38472_009385 [Pythium oligandrum]|eukprot:TMW65218.1 hypothetical protein Poli38472_009385 [Pythium oligandrum]
MASVASASGSGSAETVKLPHAIVVGPNATRNATVLGGSCSHYAPGPDGCAQPRTCADCLLKEGCMINQYGECVSQSDKCFNSSIDFHEGLDLNLVFPEAAANNADTQQYWQFPSLNATYCDSSDSVCRKCRDANFWLASYRSDSRYCVGESGCICIASCEINWSWNNFPKCPNDDSDSDDAHPGQSSSMKVVTYVMIGSLGVFVFCWLTVWYTGRKYRAELERRDALQEQRLRERQEAREQARTSVTSGLQRLSLDGWNRFRRELVEKEHSHLAGADAESSTASGPVATNALRIPSRRRQRATCIGRVMASHEGSSGDAELTRTTITPQDVATNITFTGGTCAHYPPVYGQCAKSRVCSDCLLKEGCTINPYGQCVTADVTTSDWSMDFRRAQERGLVFPAAKNTYIEQRWYFPAFSATYCASSDPVCQLCRQENFWISSVYGYDSRYCIGANGCICISACDSVMWQYNNGEDCSYLMGDGQIVMSDGNAALKMRMFSMLGFLGALVIAFGVYTVVRRRHQIELARLAEQREARRQALQAQREQSRATAVLGLQSLSLSGWAQHRRELIDKEQTRLASGGERSTTLEAATAYVSIEDANDDVIVAAVERSGPQSTPGAREPR